MLVGQQEGSGLSQPAHQLSPKVFLGPGQIWNNQKRGRVKQIYKGPTEWTCDK